MASPRDSVRVLWCHQELSHPFRSTTKQGDGAQNCKYLPKEKSIVTLASLFLLEIFKCNQCPAHSMFPEAWKVLILEAQLRAGTILGKKITLWTTTYERILCQGAAKLLSMRHWVSPWAWQPRVWQDLVRFRGFRMV